MGGKPRRRRSYSEGWRREREAWTSAWTAVRKGLPAGVAKDTVDKMVEMRLNALEGNAPVGYQTARWIPVMPGDRDE